MMQPPSDHHSFFFFEYSETDSAMKKRTAESLYEMMQPLSDHHRIHTRHCEMLRFFKALAINTSWCSPCVTTNEVEKPLSGAKSSTNKMHGSPCLTHAKLNSL